LLWILTGMLESFPAGFEEQAMLRIHTNCFTWRNVKKLCIEPIDIFYKAGRARIGFSRSVGIRVVVVVNIPAIRGNFGDGIDAVTEHSPEFINILRARKTATHANHRN